VSLDVARVHPVIEVLCDCRRKSAHRPAAARRIASPAAGDQIGRGVAASATARDEVVEREHRAVLHRGAAIRTGEAVTEINGEAFFSPEPFCAVRTVCGGADG